MINYGLQILILFLAFSWGLSSNEPSSVDYHIVMYINGESYPQDAQHISLINLAQLDSIGIMDGKEIIHEIPDWEIVVVGKYKSSYILSEFSSNVVDSSFMKKLAKLHQPKVAFLDVNRYKAKVCFSKVHPRTLDID